MADRNSHQPPEIGFASGEGAAGPGYPAVSYSNEEKSKPVQYIQPGPTAPGAPHAPQHGSWSEPPRNGPPPGCPPGLEYLTMVDQLLVKQKVELLEAFTGFETENKYDVLNSMGQKIYRASEDGCCCCCSCCYVCCKRCVRCWGSCQRKATCCCKQRPFDIGIYDNSNTRVINVHRPLRASSCWYPCCLQEYKKLIHMHCTFINLESGCCTRLCCGNRRPFMMKVVSAANGEVIHVDRPLACSSCWFPCCLQKVTVSAPPGNVVGYVKQDWSLCRPWFSIQNEQGSTVLIIEGPCCTYSCCCGDVEFKVLSKDGSTQVGKVSKQWSGFAKEKFTDADNFGISFPQDLDVKIKATILGACFLIDFMYFEESPASSKDKPGMLD